jgi:hypothetical protein
MAIELPMGSSNRAFLETLMDRCAQSRRSARSGLRTTAVFLAGPILFVALSVAGRPDRSGAELGFYSPNDPRVPSAAAQKAAAIFRIVPFTKRPLVILREDYERRLRSPEPEENPFLHRLIRDEVEKCRQTGQDSCRIPFDSYGTAFLAGRSDLLWTAAHLFGAAPFAHDGGHSQSLPAPEFLLFDREGQCVLDTRERDCAVEFAFLGPSDGPNRIPNELRRSVGLQRLLCSADAVAVIQLSCLPAGPGPLEIEAPIPAPDDPVFVLGYPRWTTTREKRYGVPDSDGMTLRASFGKVLGCGEAVRILTGEDPGWRLAEEADHALIAFDAEAEGGSSGSPVLGANGRVLGLLSCEVKCLDLPGSAEVFRDSFCTVAWGPRLWPTGWRFLSGSRH